MNFLRSSILSQIPDNKSLFVLFIIVLKQVFDAKTKLEGAIQAYSLSRGEGVS